MARKKFSCDFETTTDENDCRVWSYGYMQVGKKSNYKIGNNIEDFMEFCKKSKSDIYFHNLKFDGSFIINYLMKHGYVHNTSGKKGTFNTIISNMNQWYMIDICYGYKGKRKLHTVLYDSMKKLPFSVKKIAKDFNLPIKKGEIDYHKYRGENHQITDKEYSYLKNDIEIIASALEIQFNQGLTKMTNGSDSISDFKTSINKKNFERHFPVLSLEADTNIRLAYRGGFTWLNERYANKEVGEGLVYDVNSLYPSQMYDRELPYGQPIFFEGEYIRDEQYPLYIQHIKCDFEIKEGKIPIIQIKKNLVFTPTEYLKSSDSEYPDLYVTNIDLELIKEHYHLYNLEYKSGWKFMSKKGLFKNFIDKWTYVKINNTGAKRLLAKLMLNSLYGKFASNPNVTGKEPYLKEDGSNGFRVGEEEFKDPVYTPMGVFITSWARYTTITTAQKVYPRLIYIDTDSIHIEGLEIPKVIEHIIDDNKLGYWAHESTFKRAKFLRQKTYIEEIYGKYVKKGNEKKFKECGKEDAETTLISVKCSGMNDDIKKKVTFENFKHGFSKMGMLKPKQVPGGVVLVDRPFTLK